MRPLCAATCLFALALVYALPGVAGEDLAAKGTEDLRARSAAFRSVVRQAKGAVVHILCSLPGDAVSRGSGVIIDEQGFILTSYHVVRAAEKMRVHLADRRRVPGQLISFDPLTDLAMLRIHADDLKAASLGDSDAIEVGDWVLAIGSPLGFQHTVTAGIVSATGRDFYGDRDDPFEGYQYFIQTDAAVYEGSSGGPLLNLDGEVVGITHSATLIRPGPEGRVTSYTPLAFATPIDFVKNVLEPMKQGRGAPRGRLGVGLRDVGPAIAAAMDLDEIYGAQIQHVERNSTAADANLHTGDLILAVEGVRVRNRAHLRSLIACKPVGEEISVQVLRNGQRFEREFVLRGQPTLLEDRKLLGIALMDLTKVWADQLGLDAPRGALVVAIIPGGRGEATGLRPGMVISAINAMPVPDIRAYAAAAKQLDEAEDLQLAVNIGGKLYLVRLHRNAQGLFRPAPALSESEVGESVAQ